ncbi:multicopper oxidase domain-containing protein [Streptomyces sp. NPDC020807]|uniref:multicopper oxidase family protein n=1 Tax=Streptomyces sp. NPDC020807 TaxID=3155119 RepID=UPI0033C78BA1
MKRRTLLTAGGAVLGTGALTAAGWPLLSAYAREGHPGRLLRSRTALPPAYATALPIPPVLRPTGTTGTTDTYEITARHADLSILPGLKTPAWTYNGSFPGPTIVSRSGRRTVVRHRNELDLPTVVHLHGGHTPASSDGYPTSLILPADGSYTAHDVHQEMAAMDAMHSGSGGGGGGHAAAMDLADGTRTYTYPFDQRAATLWYHDHRMGHTGAAVWKGLAGFHLVHDDEEERLPLPKGDRDIPLMITDRAFNEDGTFQYPAVDPRHRTPGVTTDYMNGVLGDVILVNGAAWPVHPTRRLRYRLRLLNASNARPYRLYLDPPPPGGDAFIQIGSDGGLLETPVTHDTLDIAPAERYDVVIDFSRYAPGTKVQLRNAYATGPTGHVMRFDLGHDAPRDTTGVPARLSTIPRLDPAKAVVTRDFHLTGNDTGWTINGRPYIPGYDFAQPKLGTTEIWRFTTNFHHPLHVHLNHFQILSRNNQPPGPQDHGLKDTIDLRPAQTLEIATQFTQYTGTYMLHCHNLEHEDMAMMGDFTTE